ncbi:DUF6310 domain-containing protein [Myxococcus sp. K15C18031901]|uniref:DUF6310 domain-containing protein n=1 Tax=Myxococcus dinghuensis TaxID=2906761 RepID=UPI0020A6F3BA|nr:DUF6310 domain-containing protein [Myxococcus dinghuensis]MCP3103124.1 DUF6310 domain-containing protein [Myxococcus dinghuensis]
MLPAPIGLAPPVPLVIHPESATKQPSVVREGDGMAASSEEPEPRPARDGQGARTNPPPPVEASRRPECALQWVPHSGGDAVHDRCADAFPPNRFPGKDVLVHGKRFDALQVGANVLWEIKTDRFDGYSRFLRAKVVDTQVPELQRERAIALGCGYGFRVGVSSEAHRAALLVLDADLDIVVTGC